MKKMLLLVGPSGSGKSTVEKVLSENGFYKVISHTTREKRDGEIHGKDYYFVTKEEFESNKDNFIEVAKFGGNYYGAHSSEVSTHYNIVIVVEPDGAKQILQWGKLNNVQVLIAYLDTSKETQVTRMKSRGDKVELIEKRMILDNIREKSEDLDIDIKINTEKLSPTGVVNLLITFYNEVR